MTQLAWALALLAAGGLAALVAGRRRPRLALLLGSGAAALASLLGLAASLGALGAPPQSLRIPWSVPWAEIHLRLDPLSAWFETALFALALPASIYGATYMRPHLGRRSLGAFLFFFDLFLAALAVVFAARDAVLFLIAWEVMTVASFALVTFEHEQAEVRRAGLVFLVASHLGTAFLFALFVLLGRHAGSFDMDRFEALRATVAAPSLFFALGALGFGTKAGLAPLHVWLPEAHPAAPSHVSALLSGVMIKTGIYGLVRVLGFLPPAPAAWGYLLAAVGLVSALAAITLALGQRDLKRALAYSSVENMGIVALGLGLGLAAGARGAAAASVLGFGGALLHVWNHALMKGLAFMGAGALAHATHTRDLERMGGLLGRLPATGGLFLLSAAALAALPPLNGFASEWLVYLGLLSATAAPTGGQSLAVALGITCLALVGAVAAIAFTRLAGAALLGAPRSDAAAHAEEPGPGLWGPLALPAAGCVFLGLFPDVALRLAAPVLAQVAGLASTSSTFDAAKPPPLGAPGAASSTVAEAAHSLAVPMRITAVALLGAALAVALLRQRLRAGRASGISETWGCGFSGPTARMEYTASSYAQLFLSGLAPRWLQPRGRVAPPRGIFPRRSTLSTEPQDPARVRLFDPLFRGLADRFARLRRFQAERLYLQLFYTVATVLALAAALWIRELLT